MLTGWAGGSRPCPVHSLHLSPRSLHSGTVPACAPDRSPLKQTVPATFGPSTLPPSPAHGGSASLCGRGGPEGRPRRSGLQCPLRRRPTRLTSHWVSAFHVLRLLPRRPHPPQGRPLLAGSVRRGTTTAATTAPDPPSLARKRGQKPLDKGAWQACVSHVCEGVCGSVCESVGACVWEHVCGSMC